jgi:hypothetical protein
MSSIVVARYRLLIMEIAPVTCPRSCWLATDSTVWWLRVPSDRYRHCLLTNNRPIQSSKFLLDLASTVVRLFLLTISDFSCHVTYACLFEYYELPIINRVLIPGVDHVPQKKYIPFSIKQTRWTPLICLSSLDCHIYWDVLCTIFYFQILIFKKLIARYIRACFQCNLLVKCPTEFSIRKHDALQIFRK